MDSDGDGRVSFEDFRTGLRTVKKMLKYPQPTAHSTPGDRMKSNYESYYSVNPASFTIPNCCKLSGRSSVNLSRCVTTLVAPVSCLWCIIDRW